MINHCPYDGARVDQKDRDYVCSSCGRILGSEERRAESEDKPEGVEVHLPISDDGVYSVKPGKK